MYKRLFPYRKGANNILKAEYIYIYIYYVKKIKNQNASKNGNKDKRYKESI